jgi:hypothetical protein
LKVCHKLLHIDMPVQSSFLERYRANPAVAAEATLQTKGLRESLYLHWDTTEGREHVLHWPTMRPRPLLPCLEAFWEANDPRWHELVKASDMGSQRLARAIAGRWALEGPTDDVITAIYLKFDGMRAMKQVMPPLMPDFLRNTLYLPIEQHPVFLMDVWIAYGPFDTGEHTARLGDLLLHRSTCNPALNVTGRFAPALRPREALEHVAQQHGAAGQEARRLL